MTDEGPSKRTKKPKKDPALVLKEKEERKQIKALPQYIYGFIVVLGALVLGTTIGWSSPAQGILEKEGINTSEFKWISSMMPLGGALSQFLTAFLMDHIGRKWAIWILALLTAGSWAMMSINFNFILLCSARLFQGIASGGFCIVCPAYIGEMAHKYHRGALGVCFQLFLVVGIMCTYVMGLPKNYLLLNIASGAWAILTVILVFFIPESPLYLIKKNREDKANEVMVKIRGRNYDYKTEIEEFKKATEKHGNAWQEFKMTVNLRAFFVVLMFVIIQQMSGINAVIYYAHSIFLATGVSISSDVSALTIGAAQIAMTLIAVLIVDRVGRRILWMVSLLIMCASIVLVGLFFSVKRDNEDAAMSMAYVPTLAVVVYIAGFSIGVGPLPWSMIGEYFSANLKSQLCMMVGFINGLLIFMITCVFPIMQEKFADYIDFVFYFFGGVCLLAFFFILVFVVETANKSLEEIQNDIATQKTVLFKKKEPVNS